MESYIVPPQIEPHEIEPAIRKVLETVRIVTRTPFTVTVEPLFYAQITKLIDGLHTAIINL